MPTSAHGPLWVSSVLSDLAEIGSGAAPPPGARVGDYPLMGANGPIGTLDRANFGPGYIVGRVGAAGAVNFVAGRCWVSDNTLTVVPRPSACSAEFLGHLLNYLRPDQLATRNAQPLVTQTNLAAMAAVVSADLHEQCQIAAVLDTIDNAIRKTEQIISKLKQVKQGLLHDLLTRGIDDNGELRDPVRHPEQFKDSPLGRIPRAWEVGTVGSHCNVNNTLRKPIASEIRATMPGAYAYYGPTGILDHVSEFRVEGTFVLIGEDGDHFLKFSEWPMTQLVSGRFNVNNHAHVLSGARCRTDWIDVWFRHRDITLHLTRQGAGRFKLNKASLRAMPFAIPPEEEQLAARERDQALEAQLQAERRGLAKLVVLKAGLMEDLLTGRVRVTKLLESSSP